MRKVLISKKENHFLNEREIPKNWIIRNNSSNVAAILRNQPEESKITNNTCYCTDKSIKPRFFQKSKSCAGLENVTKNDIAEIYTERRKKYENIPKMAPLNQYFRPSNSDTNLMQVSDFSKGHYFDTHFVDEFRGYPKHKCRHKFKLDERNLMKPINSDGFGTSRCSICRKPLDMETVSGGNGGFTRSGDNGEISGGNGGFMDYYKYGLAPRGIYLPRGDIQIELVDSDVIKIPKIKKPDYINTFALRFQKGVV